MIKLVCPHCLAVRKFEEPDVYDVVMDDFVLEGLSRCCKKPIRLTCASEVFSLDVGVA